MSFSGRTDERNKVVEYRKYLTRVSGMTNRYENEYHCLHDSHSHIVNQLEQRIAIVVHCHIVGLQSDKKMGYHTGFVGCVRPKSDAGIADAYRTYHNEPHTNK